VPEADPRFFPAELFAKVGSKRARGAGGQGAVRVKMESRLGLDDAAEALFGDEVCREFLPL